MCALRCSQLHFRLVSYQKLGKMVTCSAHPDIARHSKHSTAQLRAKNRHVPPKSDAREIAQPTLASYNKQQRAEEQLTTYFT